MARGSKISVLGLYSYDKTLFDEMVIPESVDRSVLINNLLMECAEFECLYPDSDFMKSAIGQWSLKEVETWKILNEMLSQANPLDDINVTETEHHDYMKKETGSDKTEGESTSQVNGWNDGMVDRNKTTDSNTRTPNLNNSDVGDRVKTIKGLSSKYLKQDLIRKEIELRTDFDIDDIIIDEFKNRFCLLIY